MRPHSGTGKSVLAILVSEREKNRERANSTVVKVMIINDVTIDDIQRATF